VAGLAGSAIGAFAACAPSPRDVAGGGEDVRLAPGEAATTPAAPPADGYAHVARRARGVVALAEARHARGAVAAAFVERLADELEACAAALEARGELVFGAARIVALAGPQGTAEGLNVRLAPGGAVAQNALLCVLAPLRALPFPPSTDGVTPGLALEITWGPSPVRSGKLQPDGADAGLGGATH
jgi:hypothetical protein